MSGIVDANPASMVFQKPACMLAPPNEAPGAPLPIPTSMLNCGTWAIAVPASRARRRGWMRFL
ncbi:MAG: hypothetical protein IPK67_16215 [Planctomycetes bacterium]|nr:hypothetical protein [Planctomycetota bacterium]